MLARNDRLMPKCDDFFVEGDGRVHVTFAVQTKQIEGRPQGAREENRMPDCKNYGGITRDELNLLRGDLKREGITIPEGDQVSFSGPQGIQLEATYDENKQTLRICIIKKPFFIPESMIWQFIDAGVEPYEGP